MKSLSGRVKCSPTPLLGAIKVLFFLQSDAPGVQKISREEIVLAAEVCGQARKKRYLHETALP